MKSSRSRSLFWLLAAAVVLAGLSSAVGVFHVPWLDSWFGGEAPASGRPALQRVECLGRVDVEGGVLELAPVRSGRVVAVPVREGQTVAAGTVLLRLDEQLAHLQIQHARAAQEAAQAHVALAEEAARSTPRVWPGMKRWPPPLAVVRRLRAELRRKERLFHQGLIGKEERAAAQEEGEALEALAEAEAKRLEAMRGEDPALKVGQARAEVERARVLLAEAQYGLEQCVVTAPAAGSVLRLRCGVGEVISPQLAVIVFAPARPYLVRAEVEQEFIHLVAVGLPAIIRDEMSPESSWKGRVTRVSDWYSDNPSIPRRMARFTDIPTVECRIALDPGHPPLRLGQRVTVLLDADLP